jgi:hypothetical protein
MSVGSWNILGLFLVMIGVLDLFVFGMPFRIPTDGAVHLILERRNEAEAKKDQLYKVLGYVGMVFVVAGTLCQIAANIPYFIK